MVRSYTKALYAVCLLSCLAGLALGSGCIGSECVRSVECGEGRLCERGRCQTLQKDPCQDAGEPCRSCSKDADCPTDYHCIGDNCVLQKPGCQRDEDCKEQAQPFCSDAQKCEWQCKRDGDCKGKTKPLCSAAHRCEWSCRKDGDCGQGELCAENECIKDELRCQSDADCKGKARPFCSDAKKCEWECKGPLDCPVQRECLAGLCKRRPGVCEEQSHCKSGEVCVLKPQPYHHCAQACDPKRPRCPQGAACHVVPELGSFCIFSCNPQKPSCPSGTFCKVFPLSSQLPKGALCVPTVKHRGPGEKGQACEQKPNQACQSHKGLFCFNPVLGDRPKVCAKSCDPKTSFLDNPACDTGESCVFSLAFYPVFAKGGVCTVAGPQKEGDPCSIEPLNTRNQCQRGLYCRYDVQGVASTRCAKACDPSHSDGCGADQRCNPDPISPLGGTCFAKQEGPGSPCLNKDSCATGLTCGSFCQGKCGSFCLKSCKNDGDCGPKQRCFGHALEERFCLDRCDLSQGISSNPSCKSRQQCTQLRFGAALDAVCLPLPTARKVSSPPKPVALHTFCEQGLDDPCDTAKGQRCLYAIDGMTTRCYQLCDPTKGVVSNPACGGGACMEHYNERGGICEPLGAAKKGEACSLHKPCAKGLVCHGFLCVDACDSSSACKAGQFCWRARCVNSCDPKRGILPNPSCRSGQLCWVGWPPDLSNPLQDYEPPFWKPYCRSLASPVEGHIQPGQFCPDQARFGNLRRLEDNCDERKGYVCGDGKCAKACDPYKGYFGNPNCAQGQACLTTYRIFYHLKEFWRGKPPSSLGGFCATPCHFLDPLSSCPAGHICQRMSYGQAVCMANASIQQGPREKGESCRIQTCNGQKGLFCSTCDYGKSVTYPKWPGWDCTRICRQTCDPTQSNTCGGDRDCLPSRTSQTGGGCWRKPHRKLGESCDLEDNRCMAGMRCYNSYDNPFPIVPGDPFVRTCRKACDPSREKIGQASGCPAGFGCFAAQNYALKQGICARLPLKLMGPQGLGQICTTTYDCDATKGLTCLSFGKQRRCVKVCDRQTGQGCGSTETCVVSPYSSTGAVCAPASPTTQKEGEFCLTSHNYCEKGLSCVQYRCLRDKTEGQLCHLPRAACAKGLYCWGDRCLRRCDVSKGQSNNPACRPKESCRPTTQKHADQGVCLP